VQRAGGSGREGAGRTCTLTKENSCWNSLRTRNAGQWLARSVASRPSSTARMLPQCALSALVAGSGAPARGPPRRQPRAASARAHTKSRQSPQSLFISASAAARPVSNPSKHAS